MKTKIAIAIILMVVVMSAGAEVYKCDKGGKSTYQSKPCDIGAPDNNKLNVKRQTAEEEATAKAKLKEIEAHNTERKGKDEKAATSSMGIVPANVPVR